MVGLSSAEGARRELTATADDVLPAISNEHLYTFFFANSAPPSSREGVAGAAQERSHCDSINCVGHKFIVMRFVSRCSCSPRGELRFYATDVDNLILSRRVVAIAIN